MPIGADIEVPEGESLLSAAQRAGFKWPTVCGGRAECTVCFVMVESGWPGLPTRPERERLMEVGRDDPAVRLAFQLHPESDLVVRKLGVRAPEAPVPSSMGTSACSADPFDLR